MDRTDGRIRLALPTIDLLECKKFKGGYHEESIYDTDNYYPEEGDSAIYGGEIDPAIVYGDSTDDNYCREDDFDRDDNRDDNQNEYDRYENDREDDIEDRDNHNNDITTDTILSPMLVSLILKDKSINYLFDQNYIDQKSSGNIAYGMIIFSGNLLPNGTVAQVDTIVLGDNATVGTLLEEIFHCWQGNNLYDGTGSPSEATSAMEFMHKTFGAIYDFLDGDVTWGDASDEAALPQEWLLHIMECYNWNSENPQFDWNNFIQGWNVDYFDQWLNMYDEHPYGRGNDDHWKWDWQEAKEYYESIYGKGDNLQWLWNEAGNYYDS